jgi:hypothetical protein
VCTPPVQPIYQVDDEQLGRGTFARDIAYVLGTAPTVAERRQWEKGLVQLYLSELAKAGGPKIAEEKAWKEIAIQSFAGAFARYVRGHG